MKYTALALLFFALNWIPLRAQIDVKRKLEKKADQVLDEFLFGKKKNKDNAPQASYPSGGDPMETYEPSDDNDPLGGYKREPVNFGSLNRMNVVGFRELIHFLPNQFGPYELSAKPDGATMRMGEYTYSMGGKDYTNGEDENGDLQAVIYDYLQTGNLLAAYVNQYEYETTDGIMKSVTVNGQPGWFTEDYSSAETSLTLVVNGRFMIMLSGYDLSEDTLRGYMTTLDIDKLPEGLPPTEGEN